jgi:hypothetical protein
MTMELVRLLHKTPQEIGKLRRNDPAGIRFLEKKIIWEYKEKEKQQKEMERKSKSGKKGRKH